MIVNDRITSYIHSLDSGNGSLCDAIEEEAALLRIPVIRRETAAFLKTLVALKRPGAILEVGTAVGYSALLMCRAMPERIPAAKENFKRAGEEKRITLVEGDAGEALYTLSGPYDFIFMDAAKGQYPGWLDRLLFLLSAGGVLVSDNIFQDGDIIESRYAVERRNRTIHARMRDYLYRLTHMEELETSLVPIGDGVAVSVKKERVKA